MYLVMEYSNRKPQTWTDILVQPKQQKKRHKIWYLEC